LLSNLDFSPPRSEAERRMKYAIPWFLVAAWWGLCLAPAVSDAQGRDPYYDQRMNMVDDYIKAEGITNSRVLNAMRKVLRHEFVSRQYRSNAYHDTAIEIGYGQTISPPFIVAYMTETIDPQPDDRILEIGTGSGYQAAVLAEIADQVYSIEIVEPLGVKAGERLAELGYENVHTKVGDGYLGWEEHAPFDKVIVTCSPEKVPDPLLEQLKEGGKMIVPLGERYQQTFYLFEKKDGKLVEQRLIPTLFVPMTGVSEQNREVKPDPLNPRIVNGSFEIDENEDGKPDNWHYQRQLKLITTGGTHGNNYIQLLNLVPGQFAQALQGTAIDGRKLGRLQVRASVAFSDLRVGLNADQKPGIVVHFYDERRKLIRTELVGPWLGNSSWRRYGSDIAVPDSAREMILSVGLHGGTGTLHVDDVRIRALKR
jgi:protein-L-isoaspartate(D-aspartate) O-methyltransferase